MWIVLLWFVKQYERLISTQERRVKISMPLWSGSVHVLMLSFFFEQRHHRHHQHHHWHRHRPCTMKCGTHVNYISNVFTLCERENTPNTNIVQTFALVLSWEQVWKSNAKQMKFGIDFESIADSKQIELFVMTNKNSWNWIFVVRSLCATNHILCMFFILFYFLVCLFWLQERKKYRQFSQNLQTLTVINI